MNGEIFRLALPNIISSITVPLIGLLSTAMVGNWSGSAEAIGALAVGASIFNFIYWNCSFVRMGTSGLTAQAFGANNLHFTTIMLARTLLVSAILGIAVLVLQRPLGELALWMMQGSSMVADYFYARVWAVPAGIILFGLYGWLTGMQNATIPMISSIVVNTLHVAVSYILLYHFDMGIVGVAYGSVAAQWAGVVLTLTLLLWRFGPTLRRIRLAEVLQWSSMREFFKVNSDVMIRNFCNVAVYTFFTAASSRMGSATVLAVNTILMQLLMLFSYMNDGFAFAAEALTGRFIGARCRDLLGHAMRWCAIWSIITAVFVTAVYAIGWRDIFALMIDEGTGAELTQMLDVAAKYVGWIMTIPIIAAMPFMLDGVMVGATLTRVMRNTMLGATIIFFASYYALQPLLGNDALWLAYTLYIALRLVLQYILSHRLDDILRKAE